MTESALGDHWESGLFVPTGELGGRERVWKFREFLGDRIGVLFSDVGVADVRIEVFGCDGFSGCFTVAIIHTALSHS